MSTDNVSTDSEDLSEERVRLIQRANLVRSRMLRRIDVLQARRQAVGRALRGLRVEVRHLLPAAAGVLVVVGTGIGLLLRARAERARRRQGWLLPAEHEEPSFVTRALRGLAVSLLTRVAQRATEQAMRRYFAARVTPAALPPARDQGFSGV